MLPHLCSAPAHGHLIDLCELTHCRSALERQLGAASPQPRRHPLHRRETLWFHGQRAQACSSELRGRTACLRKSGRHHDARQGSGRKPDAVAYLAHRPLLHRRAATRVVRRISRRSDRRFGQSRTGPPRWEQFDRCSPRRSGRAVMLAVDSAQISAEDFRLQSGAAWAGARSSAPGLKFPTRADHFLFHGRGSATA